MTRDDLLDPNFLPTHGMLRWYKPSRHEGPDLQVYNSTTGVWEDVPIVCAEDLKAAGAT